MCNASIMQEFQGIGNVASHQWGFLLGEAHFALDVVQQRAATHLLENHVETILVLEPLDQLDWNIGFSFDLIIL